MTAHRREKGACVAPGCGADTPSPWHHLCGGCEKRCTAAMVEARPALMEAMVTERREAEAWLAADWAPVRRWVVADREYRPEPLDAVVERLVEEVASTYGDSSLGFVDDVQHARLVAWDRERATEPEREPRSLLAWRVASDSEAGAAWRAHLAPLLAAALEQALASFPLTWAGREIKDAMTGSGEYGTDDVSAASEEILEGTGPNGLSDGARYYIELRDDPKAGYICEADGWPDGIGTELWERYRVLPDDIMVILDAARRADERLRA